MSHLVTERFFMHPVLHQRVCHQELSRLNLQVEMQISLESFRSPCQFQHVQQHGINNEIRYMVVTYFLLVLLQDNILRDRALSTSSSSPRGQDRPTVAAQQVAVRLPPTTEHRPSFSIHFQMILHVEPLPFVDRQQASTAHGQHSLGCVLRAQQIHTGEEQCVR